jgi:hypothetical protein
MRGPTFIYSTDVRSVRSPAMRRVVLFTLSAHIIGRMMDCRGRGLVGAGISTNDRESPGVVESR